MSGWEWFVLATAIAAIAWAIVYAWAHHRVTGHLNAADRYPLISEACATSRTHPHDRCMKDWCDCECHRVVVT